MSAAGRTPEPKDALRLAPEVLSILLLSLPALVSLSYYELDEAYFALGRPDGVISAVRIVVIGVTVFIAAPLTPPATAVALYLAARAFWFRRCSALQAFLVVALLAVDLIVSKYVLNWLMTPS